MHTTIFPILSTLRDVDGVQGAFVIADDGSLVDLDMPAMFEPALFGEVGPRIVRLRETLASTGEDVESCAIRFSDFKLYVRTMQKGFLCILSAIAVNMPALKMGVQLAQRRIMAELGSPEAARTGSASSVPPSSLAPPNWTSGAYGPAAGPPTSSPPASSPPSTKAGLTYRGRPVR
jgi:predicted regulator of Ras-like GTPase activity (Roadblock/LC7/MglB family)